MNEVKKATRSRRVDGVKTINKNGQIIESVYCRKCCETKKPSEFYSAVDNFLDANGYFSLCKSCIGKIYVNFYKSESNLEKAIYKLCKTINLKYDVSAVDALRSQYNAKGKEFGDESDVGIYKARLVSVQRSFGEKADNLDLTFQYETQIINTETINDEDFDGQGYDMKIKWGADLSADDYIFLEEKLYEWKADYSCQNKAELFLMKELCFKELELKNARVGGLTNVDSILKSMDNLLKSAALTPAQSTASSGGAKDTWGLMMKQIETTRPAEFYGTEDKKLFKDFDNLGAYITNYIKRPMLNFWGASKSFELVGEDESFELIDNTIEEASENSEDG